MLASATEGGREGGGRKRERNEWLEMDRSI
jgi:hypothetical protein